MELKEIESIIGEKHPSKTETLRKRALSIMNKEVGSKVYFRGIIEFSNVCEKNCYYCGIRRDNHKVQRYVMNEQEILECAHWAHIHGYGSIVLQSGESTSKGFIDSLVKVVSEIKKTTGKKGKPLGITLSIGEQHKKTYEELFQAGAHRYLLRIETSNRELYKKLHPENHSFDNRLRCLRDLKEIGYQVGTGVMIGLPGQSDEDLARDVVFFKEIDADMIGMGPYVMHMDTPLSYYADEWSNKRREILQKALNMIAATRIYLKDVNIASTTAFQALHPTGRELALEYGANIIMPAITPRKYRENYLLYQGKPCIDEDATKCKSCLAKRIMAIGRSIGWKEYGDSPHALMKKHEKHHLS